MEPVGTSLGRFPSKFLLMVIPGLVASGVVASVLYAVHVSRAPSSSDVLTDVAPQGDGLSAEERRGLTRQMLKARRENPEEPAEVRPIPTSRPAEGGPAQDSATDAKTPPDYTSADRSAPLPVARPALARARPDAPPVTPPPPVAAPVGIPPPAAAAAQAAPPPPGTTDTALQSPVTVHPGAETEPEPRGFAANVFSSLSHLAGSAANATGNTVNWVIDLPGKAISAGGRLLGGDSSANNQPAGPPPSAGVAPPPAAVPPPATAPPKRNL